MNRFCNANSGGPPLNKQLVALLKTPVGQLPEKGESQSSTEQ